MSYDAALAGLLAPTVHAVTVRLTRPLVPPSEHTFDWEAVNTNREPELQFAAADRSDPEGAVVDIQGASTIDPDCGDPLVIDADCAGLRYALNPSRRCRPGSRSTRPPEWSGAPSAPPPSTTSRPVSTT